MEGQIQVTAQWEFHSVVLEADWQDEAPFSFSTLYFTGLTNNCPWPFLPVHIYNLHTPPLLQHSSSLWWIYNKSVCVCASVSAQRVRRWQIRKEEGVFLRWRAAQRGGGLTDTAFTSILIWRNGVSQLALLACDVLASYCISLYLNYLVLLFLMGKSQNKGKMLKLKRQSIFVTVKLNKNSCFKICKWFKTLNSWGYTKLYWIESAESTPTHVISFESGQEVNSNVHRKSVRPIF